MTKVTRHFDQSDIKRLLALVGTNWSCLGSEWPMTNNLMEPPVFVASEASDLSLSAVQEYFDVDGDEFSVSSVCISGAGSELEKAKKNGNVYFQGKGEKIREALVVRETVRATFQSVPFFEAEIDFGVVFVLENSVIGISKRGFHGEDFMISRASSIEELKFFDSAIEWSATLMTQYEFGRKLINVSELL